VIRVKVVSASAIVRAGLESLLRSQEAMEVVSKEPDVVVMDQEGADDDILQELLSASSPPVVLLSGSPQPAWLRAGVRAILPRETSPAELAAAVQAAAAGLVALHPQALDDLLIAPPQTDGGALEPLTPRELGVLRMLAEGLGNKEIAWKLGLSEHTIKFHVASIMSKLNAASRTEAVTTGIRRGLIPL
jgi:DNA-binding NarL/FixJ family response regulator